MPNNKEEKKIKRYKCSDWNKSGLESFLFKKKADKRKRKHFLPKREHSSIEKERSFDKETFKKKCSF